MPDNERFKKLLASVDSVDNGPVQDLAYDILRLSTIPRVTVEDPQIMSGEYYYAPGIGNHDFRIRTYVFDHAVESGPNPDHPRFSLILRTELLPDADNDALFTRKTRRLPLDMAKISGGRFETIAGSLMDPPLTIPPTQYPMTFQYDVAERALELGLLSPVEQKLLTNGLIRALYARFELKRLDPSEQWEDEVEEEEIDPHSLHPYVARRMGFEVPFDTSEFASQEEAEEHWAWTDSLDSSTTADDPGEPMWNAPDSVTIDSLGLAAKYEDKDAPDPTYDPNERIAY